MIPTQKSSLRIEPGKILLGKYRIESILGEGGMGVVVGVRHTELNALFAMKLLLPEVVERKGAVERFLSEAKAAARLVSDHVVRVHDVGELEDGSPYMLMEYLEGVDLATLLQSEGSLSAFDSIDYVLQALEAIIEAHQAGIVHRDLKPANLFLAKRTSGRSTVKVLDFGISHDEGRKGPSLTHSGVLMGTPYYMSPEQMRSAKVVDARSDVWALGVVLYELLTDAVPFPGESVTAVCARVLEGEPEAILLRAPGTPARLIEIVDKCLARKAEDRYQTAEDLAADLLRLRQALAHDRVALRPRTPLDSFTDPGQRKLVLASMEESILETSSERETLPAPLGPSPVTPNSAVIRDPDGEFFPIKESTSRTKKPAFSVKESTPGMRGPGQTEPLDAPMFEATGPGQLARSVYVPPSDRLHIATINGWSDVPRPPRPKTKMLIGGLAAATALAVGAILSLRTLTTFAGPPSPGSEKAPARSLETMTISPGPTVIATARDQAAEITPAVASSSSAAASIPAPVGSSRLSSSRTAAVSPRPSVSGLNAALPPLPRGSTSVQPRKYEGIY